MSKERLNALLAEFNLDGCFETSAKEGWQIQELRGAMESDINAATVRFIRQGKRGASSARIAIERFRLTPRGQ